LHLLERRPKDWAGFFAAAPADPPLRPGVVLAHELAASYDVVWLSGRPERSRAATLAWLEAHGLPAGPLYLRSNRDYRPAVEAKLEVLVRLTGDREVAVVVDDDPRVVDAVRAAGLPARLAEWVPYRRTLREAQEADGRT
jgi:hypothetical protein